MLVSLNDLRKRIQEIDVEIVSLLRQRMNVVLEIGKIKTDMNLPIQDKIREQQVISNVLNLPHDPIDSDSLKALFQHIMQICLKAQQKTLPYNE